MVMCLFTEPTACRGFLVRIGKEVGGGGNLAEGEFWPPGSILLDRKVGVKVVVRVLCHSLSS
jgi:hypothetical protein